MGRARLSLLLSLSMAGCAGRARLPELTSAEFPAESRITIPAMSDVSAIALSRRYVFIATTGGLAVRDRDARRWLPPFDDAALGLDPTIPARIAASDPASDGVWLGAPGRVIFVRPLERIVNSATIPGDVQEFDFDARMPGAGTWVRTSGGWAHVSSAGGVVLGSPPADARLVPADTPSDVARAYPTLAAFSRLITRDASLRTWPVTALARAPERSEVWVGTRGGGAFTIDPVTLVSESQPFGLPARYSSALALAINGVWVAGNAAFDERGGLTFVSEDLQQWSAVTGAPILLLDDGRMQIRDVDVRAGVAWLALAHGVGRIALDAGTTTVWERGRNDAPDDALTVLADDDGAWIGSRHGLARLTYSANDPMQSPVRTFLEGVPVAAIVRVADTLWLGTQAGVVRLRHDGDSLRVMPGIQDWQREPVVAFAASDTVIAWATRGYVHMLNERFPLRGEIARIAADAVAPITALGMDATTIWIGGARGVIVHQRENGVNRVLAEGTAIPDLVTDIALSPRVGWVATRSGVVWLQRLPDGSVR